MDLSLGLNRTFSHRRSAQLGTFTFSDNFNRSNEALDASTNWTKIGASTNTITVDSNSLTTVGTSTVVALYAAPDFGRTGQYIEFTLLTVANTGGPFVVLRATDEANWVGVRNATTSFQIYKNVGGTLTFINGQSGLQANDHIRFEAKGTSFRAYINGTLITAGAQTISDSILQTGTLTGPAQRFFAVNNWIDNFKQGVL